MDDCPVGFAEQGLGLKPVEVVSVVDDGGSWATWTFDAPLNFTSGVDAGLEMYAPGPGWDSFNIDPTGQGTSFNGFTAFGGYTQWRIQSTPSRAIPVIGRIGVPQSGATS